MALKIRLTNKECHPMTPMEKLAEWHADWRIIQGTINCKTCHCAQLEGDRENSFSHAPGCAKTGLKIQPWQALDDVQKAFSRAQKHD
jgi:peptide subunit release factor 1 (eRF1)